MNVNEVAPPEWGHTKAEKEKTKPNKPKSKIGGTAAAFKRALDDGRFKGLPGDKTKKEKTASMFKLMWSMKKKGAKPHYKPGTDEKYKKYQEEDWKPEVEVVDTKARAKKAEKKRKEAESSLPPHLRLDAMKKAFAHTNEEVEIEEKYKSYKQDVLNRDKAAKRGLKTGKAGSAKARRRRRSKPGGTEKLSDVNKAAERKSMQSVGGFRGVHGASRKSKSSQGPAARVVYNRKSAATTSKPTPPKGTFYALQKRIKEETNYNQRDKELKKTKKAMEYRHKTIHKGGDDDINESDFKDYMAQAQAARDRLKKKIEDRKKKDAQFVDTKTKGVKFYDKKGSGRIRSGKKIYDK